MMKPEESTVWRKIAESVASECPSPTFRHETIKILERLELLGPTRSPREEFIRVYRSLHWNEPDRVLEVMNTLLARTQGPKPKLVIRSDAWGYVVGTLDEWITQARIFYLLSGILECSLRSRLNARLTDLYGTDWPSVPEVVPSQLREVVPRQQARDEILITVQNALEEYDAGTIGANVPELNDKLIHQIRTAVGAPRNLALPAGQDFTTELNFGALRMFFERKKTWEGKAKLKEVFRGRAGADAPPQRDKVASVLQVLNDARNEIAHYRPNKFRTMEQPLFAAATLATWFGEDIQHIYSSIDTRESTELVGLLRGVSETKDWWTWSTTDECDTNDCTTKHPPLEWLLKTAPLSRDDITTTKRFRACLYHRVAQRAAVHRPTKAIEATAE